MGVCKSKNSQEQPEDSHGLYDYEGKETEKKQFKSTGTFSLMRHEIHVELKRDDEDGKLEESKEEDVPQSQIAQIVEKNGNYWIFHQSTISEEEDEIDKNPENKLWRVVKFCKSKNSNINGYKLMPDELIKLGRVRFKIKEIYSPAYQKLGLRIQNRQKKFLLSQVRQSQLRTASNLQLKNSIEMTEHDPNLQQDQIIPDNMSSNQVPSMGPSQISQRGQIPPSVNIIIVPQNIKKEEGEAPLIIREPSFGSSSGTPLCRICLSEDNDHINPLFSPCKCAGTMKFIHLNCLQEWLNSRKVTKETPNTKTYYWKNLECELCKTTYPNQVRTGDNKDIFLRVIQYELPQFQAGEEPHYMVLESISTNTSKVIHVVNMLKAEEIKIGRGHDADVRVTDISVSRLHALIKKSQKGYFYVEDNNSKFGSLVLIRNPISLAFGDPNYIQAGRTMMEIQIKRPIKLFNSCLCNQTQQNNNTGVKRFSGSRSGLTSKNGIDFFPEEFMPNPNKSRKSLNKNHSDSRLRGERQNLATGFQSDINIEDALLRDRQLINSNNQNAEQQLQIQIEQEEFDENDILNQSNDQESLNQGISHQQNDRAQDEINEEIKEEAKRESRSGSSRPGRGSRLSLRNKQDAQRPQTNRKCSRSSLNQHSKSKIGAQSEEEKIDDSAHLPNIKGQILRNVVNHNGQLQFSSDNTKTPQPLKEEGGLYLNSIEEMAQGTIQQVAQNYFPDECIIQRSPKRAKELVNNNHNNSPIEPSVALFQKVSAHRKSSKLDDNDQVIDIAPKDQAAFDDMVNRSGSLEHHEDIDTNRKLVQQNDDSPLFRDSYEPHHPHLKKYNQILAKHKSKEEDRRESMNDKLSKIRVSGGGNSNLPTERQRSNDSHPKRLRQNLLLLKKDSIQEDRTYVDDEKNVEIIQSIPKHRMISPELQMEPNMPSNDPQKRIFFNRYHQDSDQLPQEFALKNQASTAVVVLQQDLKVSPKSSKREQTLSKRSHSKVDNAVYKLEGQLVLDDISQQEIEEIKISTSINRKKKLQNVNSSNNIILESVGGDDDITNQGKRLKSTKQKKRKAPKDQKDKNSRNANKNYKEDEDRKALDFYRSLSNFPPEPNDNVQQPLEVDDHQQYKEI